MKLDPAPIYATFIFILKFLRSFWIDIQGTETNNYVFY